MIKKKGRQPGVFTDPEYFILGNYGDTRYWMNRKSAQRRWLKVFREHETQLRGYLHRFADSDHDIDDICQEAMTRCLEVAEDRPVEHPGAFLFGVARNLVRRRFERKSRSLIDFIADFSPDDYVGEERPLDDIMDEQERLARYDEVIGQLPPQCQRVFVMRKVYGYAHREIAEMLGISVKTVENHITTGLKRCSEKLSVAGGRMQQPKKVLRFPRSP